MGVHERRSREREAVRQAILRAARELFVTEGYQNVSIRKIADRIEYSPSAIYGYFKNKDDIFFALAEQGFRLFKRAMNGAVRHDHPVEALRSRLWRYYEFSKAQPQYFSLMFVDRSVPRISRDWERLAFMHDMRNETAALLERCVADGVFPRGTDPDAAFHILATAVYGASVIRLSDRFCPRHLSDALARDVLETTIAGLRHGVRTTFRAESGSHAAARQPERRTRPRRRGGLPARLALLAVLALGPSLACRGGDRASAGATSETAVEVATAKVARQPINRVFRVTGTLTADEQAEVAAEVAGRVIATPVERGTPVTEGGALAQLVPTETEAQVQEAEANAAQLEVRLGISGDQPFDVEKVPEVSNARASRDLAESEFGRIQTLFDERVVSKSEFDQRRTQVEVTRRQYETARNNAQQLYRQLEAARARLRLARKALSDTTVRAPFSGVVAERMVSVGDFVTRGARVATIVRTNPLRAELTVPEHAVSFIKPGLAVAFEVDAYPGRLFHGTVRFISPALRADQRALTAEALVPNPDGLLKPGLFVSAAIQEAVTFKALLVPSAAVRNLAGSNRVYVVKGDHVEERMVTPGQVVGDSTEITTGVSEGEVVALGSLAELSDGRRVRVKER